MGAPSRIDAITNEALLLCVIENGHVRDREVGQRLSMWNRNTTLSSKNPKFKGPSDPLILWLIPIILSFSLNKNIY